MPHTDPLRLPGDPLRVLVIDGGPLDGTASAGERASRDLLDGLVALGADVRFLPLGSVGDHDAHLLAALASRGVARVHPTLSAAMELAELMATQTVDVVIANRPGPAAMATVALQQHPEVTRIYWGHDIHSRRLEAQQATRGDVERHRARATALAERRCWNFYDLTVYPTDREASEVAAVAGSARSAACPYFMLSGADLASAANPKEGRIGLLMVGGAAHAPNLDALEWTVSEIFPLVRASLPEVQLTVVGDWPPTLVHRHASDGVHFVGRVSDEELRRLHAAALCLFAPLRFGSGTRRKIVAAMGLGLPAITTSEGQQGLLVRDGRGLEDGIIIANTAPSLASAVKRLFEDSSLWQRCADTARKAASAVYDQDHYISGIASALQRAAANRTDRRQTAEDRAVSDSDQQPG